MEDTYTCSHIWEKRQEKTLYTQTLYGTARKQSNSSMGDRPAKDV